MDLELKRYNPNGFWILKAMQDTSVRYVVLMGGSSSSKSYSFAQINLLQTCLDGENTLVLRKIRASMSRTIYEDYKVNAMKMYSGNTPAFRCKQNRITCLNGGHIDFAGMDDSEKIKGISNYKRIFMDELTEFEEGDWRQIRTRMRGREGQQLYAAFNPIAESHWIKKKVFDSEKWHDIPMEIELFGTSLRKELCKVKAVMMNEPSSIINPRTGEVQVLPPNFIWIQSTYLNNFWVVGSPDGKYGYYDVQCIANYNYDKEHDPDYYRVYALGEWGVIRTGGEFLPKFDMKKTGKFPFIPGLPVHVSVDNNVLPYITTTLWQVDVENKVIRQFAEVCAEDPENTASRAGELVCDFLMRLGVEKAYLHGDVTTKASSTIDDEKRSFFDKYMEKLKDLEVEDVTPNSNPSVASSGEFANAILDGWGGWSIQVDESCKHSIEDYLSVKKDVNGGLLKIRVKDTVTKQSYEQYGHCTDTMRYMLCDVLKQEYINYSLRRKRNTHNDDIVLVSEVPAGDMYAFVIPSFDGKCTLLEICHNELYFVTRAEIRESSDAESMMSWLGDVPYKEIIFESEKPFFDIGKKIREQYPTLRIKQPKADPDERIKATAQYVREKVRFYKVESFVESLQDYNGKDNREGANALACAIQYFIRK